MLPSKSVLLPFLLLCVLFTRQGRADILTCRPYFESWRFHASAPLSGSVALASNRIYVSTHEGTLHALRKDGGFSWSYTVDGAVEFAPTTDSAGRLVVSTSRGTVYSLAPSGVPHWVFHSPVPITSPLAVSPRGAVYFQSRRSLHAVSAGGGLLWGMGVGRGLAGPGALGDEVWLLSDAQRLLRVRTPGNSRGWKLELPPDDSAERRNPFRYQLTFSEGRVLGVVGGRLVVWDIQGRELWQRDGVDFVGVDAKSQQVAAVRGRELRWLALRDGQVLASRGIEDTPSAAPVFWNGMIVQPTAEGELWLVPKRGRVHHCPVAAASLFTPSVIGDGAMIVAPAGDGTVVGLHQPERRAAQR